MDPPTSWESRVQGGKAERVISYIPFDYHSLHLPDFGDAS